MSKESTFGARHGTAWAAKNFSRAEIEVLRRALARFVAKHATQGEAATVLGFSLANINAIVNGRTDPSEGIATALANKLGTTIAEIVKGG
jgi:plasmid maintenance system antidote protein VapI